MERKNCCCDYTTGIILNACCCATAGGDHLHQFAGWLRDGVRVLRQRVGWRGAKFDGRRNCRADAAATTFIAKRKFGRKERRYGRTAESHRRDGNGRTVGEFRSVAAVVGRGDEFERLRNQSSAITISTVGLPPAIDRLADLDARFQLAVSLHAPDDELRNQLVPVNKNIGLAAIVAAADRYFETSGRRLTFEYVLLGGLNDKPEQARKLAALLRGRLALVNLIPYNGVPGLPYQTPSKKAVQQFVQTLEKGGLNVQIRERKGDEINAACGQLRRSQNELVQLQKS